MAKTKRLISNKLIYLLLVIFPFGQLVRFEVNVFGSLVSLLPIDLIAGFFFIIFISQGLLVPKPFKTLIYFVYLAIFSQLVFISRYGLNNALVGLFYLFRLVGYVSMLIVIWKDVQSKLLAKDRLFGALILLSFLVSIFGWLQYFFYPDIRSLTVWGWDDHLFRLVGTYLDPTFTALILVFGVLLTLLKYQEDRQKRWLFILLANVLALAFTYARAGYLALLGGLISLISIKKKVRVAIFTIPLFIVLIFLLPRPSSEGVKLERLFSIKQRLTNYRESLFLIRKEPVFGLGFNNLCWAKQTYLGESRFNSHSCSGLDASLLTVLATTGVVGFVLLVNFFLNLVKVIEKNVFAVALVICLVASGVHSLFVNSLFYPWVMVYMAILMAISIKKT